MVVTMKDFFTIQDLKRKGYNKAEVARSIDADYKTISKYWKMSPEEFEDNLKSRKIRFHKADQYNDFINKCITDHPNISAAQIYSLIKQEYKITKLACNDRSFRRYVKSIRNKLGIQRKKSARIFEAVEDPKPGQQAQVDMGEILLETENGRRKKLYLFAMVLSYSRYKYVLWQSEPWTTESFINAHLSAFKFLGGRPKEIVYDQDKVLAVDENSGDIIYTNSFQSFIEQIKFTPILCRPHDPQSKGRIENVVKYAKYGFANNRIFKDIETFNEQCIFWLNTTANATVHGTTKKIPAEVFKEEEREHLEPVQEFSSAELNSVRITYHVRKDNTVLYRSNRYRVPRGTYSQGKCVYINVENDTLSIVDIENSEVIITHPLCKDTGKLIGKAERSSFTISERTKELEKNIKNIFNNSENINKFLEIIYIEKKRYYRSQLLEIKKLFNDFNLDIINKAIEYCLKFNLCNASDLKSSVIYYSNIENKNKNTENTNNSNNIKLPDKYCNNNPEQRSLSEYDQALNKE